MSDLFDRVKAAVSIVSYIERDLNAAPKREGSTFRFNPCPFCQHKDCFTVYPGENTWHCFSAACDKGGTIIDYEMERHGIAEPLEAAKSLAGKMGMSLDEPAPRGHGARPLPPPEPKRRETQALPAPEASAVRRMAADFYHGELLASPVAIAYQQATRRHTMGALTAFKVGFASGASLLKNAVAAGYTAEQLMGVGLIRKSGQGYAPIIKKGYYVYPHTIDDRVAYFTIKGEKPYQVKKEFAAPGWLCLNQDVLGTDHPVMIVEGENDLLTVFDLGSYPYVIATIGNFNTSAIVEHLQTLASGRRFLLCFDADEAGAKYTDRYGAAITAAGGTPSVIRFTGAKDIDLFLRAFQDPAGALRELIASAEPWKAPASPDAAGIPPANIYKFDSFSVLGELEDGSLVFQSRDINKIHIVTLKDLTLEKFVQIGGEAVRRRVARNMGELEDGKVHVYDLRKRLIQAARGNQLGPLRWLGQGVNALDDGRILVVNGSDAYLYDGARFEPYPEAMVERKLISRKAAARWIDFAALNERTLAMTPAKARDVMATLIRLVQQWHFCGSFDDSMVAGFVAAQIVQSVWAWRPHLWITGPQGSGKTLLINLLEELGGGLAKRFEGSSTSEAGFRQALSHDFVLPSIDEFEKTEAREQIISYLRTAGRGGVIVKGSTTQEPVEYVMKHMVAVASIETGLLRAAEKSRFLAVEMAKDPLRSPAMPPTRELDELRLDLFSLALWAAIPCRKLVAAMPRIKGHESRMAEAYAVPLSTLCISDGDPAGSLLDLVTLVLEDRKDKAQDDIPEDEDRLLEDILTSTIRVAVSDDDEEDKKFYTERPILWCLRSHNLFHHQDAAANGVWRLADGSIFLATDIIKRKLLRDTMWKDLNITSILRRIEGADRHRVKQNGKLYKGVRYFNKKLLELTNDGIPLEGEGDTGGDTGGDTE